MHALGLLGFEHLKRALQGRRGEHMHALGVERLKRALLALCLRPGSQDRRGSLGGHTHP